MQYSAELSVKIGSNKHTDNINKHMEVNFEGRFQLDLAYALLCPF